MNLKCLVLGHDYDHTFPVGLYYFDETFYRYTHKAAFCRRCKKRINNPKQAVPLRIPTYSQWKTFKILTNCYSKVIEDMEAGNQ